MGSNCNDIDLIDVDSSKIIILNRIENQLSLFFFVDNAMTIEDTIAANKFEFVVSDADKNVVISLNTDDDADIEVVGYNELSLTLSADLCDLAEGSYRYVLLRTIDGVEVPEMLDEFVVVENPKPKATA